MSFVILILTIITPSGVTVTTQEMNSMESCVYAGSAWKKDIEANRIREYALKARYACTTK